MDPPPPPPPAPLPEVNTATPPSPAAASASAVQPKPKPPTPANHPPYSLMIVSAIRILGEEKGWSKTAIKKAISSAYTNLPPAHSAVLSRHLKRLKKRGVVVMVKHSYMLPGAAHQVSLVKRGRGRPRKGAVKTTSAVGGGGGVKRGRGRPRKVAGTVGVGLGLGKRGRGRPRKVGGPIYVPTPNPQPQPIGDGLVKRGRGRPPKQIWSKLIPISQSQTESEPIPISEPESEYEPNGIGSVKRGRGRPRKETGPESMFNGSPRVKRGRGRPRKETGTETPESIPNGSPRVKRGRGRPRKETGPEPIVGVPNTDAVVEEGGGVPTPTPSSGVSGRKRGRPRKFIDMSPRMESENGVAQLIRVARGPGRPRKSSSGGSEIAKSLSSGRPVGRPKKGGILVPTIVPVGDI